MKTYDQAVQNIGYSFAIRQYRGECQFDKDINRGDLLLAVAQTIAFVYGIAVGEAYEDVGRSLERNLNSAQEAVENANWGN